jgi:DNA-binding HxlR family transcriptional regulator
MSSILNLEELAALGRYRWIVPVLAQLGQPHSGRFVVLRNALGIARETLVRTLEAGLETGWIIRNPGHGHPLRPEYILTAEGARIASACQAIIAAQQALGLPPAALTRWSLPIMRLVSDGCSRFNQIERVLADATPRALTQSLKAMAMLALVTRVIVDDYPPRTDYGLTPRGARLAAALAA